METVRENRLGGHCEFTRDELNKCRARRAANAAACRRRLRRDAQRECVSGTGLACRIGKRAVRRACRTCPVVAATTTSTTSLAGMTQQLFEAFEVCQLRCIRRVAADCLAECVDRCEGDRLALDICQEGCLDAQCLELERACTDNPSPVADQYRRCCQREGDCEEDVDCTPTTTATTTTRTTSTATTTSSTLFGAATTTTLF